MGPCFEGGLTSCCNGFVGFRTRGPYQWTIGSALDSRSLRLRRVAEPMASSVPSSGLYT